MPDNPLSEDIKSLQIKCLQNPCHLSLNRIKFFNPPSCSEPLFKVSCIYYTMSGI